MKATLSVFLLGWLLLAQSIHASSPKSVLDDEEYAVYASLITDKFFGKKQRAVVIESRTTFNSIEDIIFFKTQPDLSQRVATVDERYEFLGQRLGGISPATLNAFREKDTQANEISPRLRLRVKYTLLSKEHVVRLFQQWQGSWKYPRTTGAISFSRVGFNAKRTEALVYVGFSCGRGCCSFSRFVYLTRTKQKWRTKSHYLTWIT